jgi:hypothetical protein
VRRYAGVLALSALLAGCAPGPVDVDEPRPDEVDAKACHALVDDLPDSVADQSRRETDPESPLVAAWGDPAIILRCGLPAPRLGATASCLTVDGVDWYLPDAEVAAPGEEQGTVSITSIGREQTVVVDLPGDYWPPATALADLSPAVKKDIAATTRCR